MTTRNWLHRTSIALATVLGLGIAAAQAGEVTLTNVSYDPTRELYKAYDALFAKYWKEKTGDTVTIKVSNGGLRRPGAGGDRRPRCRCGDPGACL